MTGVQTCALPICSAPTLKHDDYEYTYPSFNLARHGELGSPYYGNPLNVAHRTYDLTIYYYAPVHAALIRLFGDDVTSIPLANTFHFALLGAVGLAVLLWVGWAYRARPALPPLGP